MGNPQKFLRTIYKIIKSSGGIIGISVDNNGNITKNGNPFPVQCAAWFGLEGHYEPWDYTWEEWKTLAENAFQTTNAVNSDMLILMKPVVLS
jgi:hypothetical protein